MEMKWGAYIIVWATFLNFALRSSLKNRATMMGNGNVANWYKESVKVFSINRQKYGFLKNLIKKEKKIRDHYLKMLETQQQVQLDN